MALESMAETRKRGDSKRLGALRSLAEEAATFNPMTDQMRDYLINKAVAAASGLVKENSRNTFRLECKRVFDLRPGEFETILALAERMWNERQIKEHSKYHIVTKINARVSGGKPLSAIKKAYDIFGALY